MGVGLSVEQFIDKALFIVVLDVGYPPGKFFFIADGTGRHCTERLTAGATGAVGRVNLHVIGQGRKDVFEAGEEIFCPGKAGVLPTRCFVKQVGAAHVAHKNEVTGEEVARPICNGSVGDEEGEVFWGMAGGGRAGRSR